MKGKTLFLWPVLTLVCLYSQLTLAHHWLLGIEGGYASRSGTVHSSTKLTATGVELGSNSQELVDNGGVYGLLGGYQWDLDNHWIAGLEVNVYWNNLDDPRDYNYLIQGLPMPQTVQYDKETTVGLSGRLGYRVHTEALPFDVLPYIRVGAEYGDVDFTVKRYDSTNNDMLVKSDTKDDHVWGWLAGIGIAFPLIDQLELRAE